MTNFSKQFFNEKRAQEFAENLKQNGAADVEIWSSRDAFNQTIHTVKWNLK